MLQTSAEDELLARGGISLHPRFSFHFVSDDTRINDDDNCLVALGASMDLRKDLRKRLPDELLEPLLESPWQSWD